MKAFLAFLLGAALASTAGTIRCTGHVARIRRENANAHLAHFSRGFSEGVASVRSVDGH